MKQSTPQRLYRVLSQQSNLTILLISLIFTALLGVIDYATGFEFSFALFYLIPVSLAAWFAGRNAGFFISICSAAAWHVANLFAGAPYSNPLFPYWNSASRLGFFFIVTLLLAQLRRAVDQERIVSRTDYLTGAVNRRAFYELAEIEINKFQRYQRPFTVVYIDLDNFKVINDQLGHTAGDGVLKIVVGKIKDNIRMSDSVARLGGDEFAILLSEANEETAQSVVTRMQQVLMREMAHSSTPITFSIGVLTCSTFPAGVNEILHQADQVMYSAKNAGKNTICFATYGEHPSDAGPLVRKTIQSIYPIPER